jgi:uncharacterized protein
MICVSFRRGAVRAMLIVGAAVAVLLGMLLAAWESSAGVGMSAVEIHSEGLPASFDGMRILQVSDLHGCTPGADGQELAARAAAARPDLIAVSGDFVQKKRWREDIVVRRMRELSAIAPVVMCYGNHESAPSDAAEQQELLTALSRGGADVLRGRSISLSRGSEHIQVLGIDDPDAFAVWRKTRGRWKKDASQMMEGWRGALSVLAGEREPGGFSLLLSHRPEMMDLYAAAGFSLVLAGHAHGGQVRLPLVGALFAPDQGLFPRYTAGAYTQAQTRMVVSRGLVRRFFRPRVGNPPEIVLIILRR